MSKRPGDDSLAASRLRKLPQEELIQMLIAAQDENHKLKQWREAAVELLNDQAVASRAPPSPHHASLGLPGQSISAHGQSSSLSSSAPVARLGSSVLGRKPGQRDVNRLQIELNKSRRLIQNLALRVFVRNWRLKSSFRQLRNKLTQTMQAVLGMLLAQRAPSGSPDRAIATHYTATHAAVLRTASLPPSALQSELAPVPVSAAAAAAAAHAVAAAASGYAAFAGSADSNNATALAVGGSSVAYPSVASLFGPNVNASGAAAGSNGDGPAPAGSAAAAAAQVGPSSFFVRLLDAAPVGPAEIAAWQERDVLDSQAVLLAKKLFRVGLARKLDGKASHLSNNSHSASSAAAGSAAAAAASANVSSPVTATELVLSEGEESLWRAYASRGIVSDSFASQLNAQTQHLYDACDLIAAVTSFEALKISALRDTIDAFAARTVTLSAQLAAAAGREQALRAMLQRASHAAAVSGVAAFGGNGSSNSGNGGEHLGATSTLTGSYNSSANAGGANAGNAAVSASGNGSGSGSGSGSGMSASTRTLLSQIDRDLAECSIRSPPRPAHSHYLSQHASGTGATAGSSTGMPGVSGNGNNGGSGGSGGGNAPSYLAPTAASDAWRHDNDGSAASDAYNATLNPNNAAANGNGSYNSSSKSTAVAKEGTPSVLAAQLHALEVKNARLSDRLRECHAALTAAAAAAAAAARRSNGAVAGTVSGEQATKQEFPVARSQYFPHVNAASSNSHSAGHSARGGSGAAQSQSQSALTLARSGNCGRLPSPATGMAPELLGTVPLAGPHPYPLALPHRQQQQQQASSSASASGGGGGGGYPLSARDAHKLRATAATTDGLPATATVGGRAGGGGPGPALPGTSTSAPVPSLSAGATQTGRGQRGGNGNSSGSAGALTWAGQHSVAGGSTTAVPRNVGNDGGSASSSRPNSSSQQQQQQQQHQLLTTTNSNGAVIAVSKTGAATQRRQQQHQQHPHQPQSRQQQLQDRSRRSAAVSASLGVEASLAQLLVDTPFAAELAPPPQPSAPQWPVSTLWPGQPQGYSSSSGGGGGTADGRAQSAAGAASAAVAAAAAEEEGEMWGGMLGQHAFPLPPKIPVGPYATRPGLFPHCRPDAGSGSGAGVGAGADRGNDEAEAVLSSQSGGGGGSYGLLAGARKEHAVMGQFQHVVMPSAGVVGAARAQRTETETQAADDEEDEEERSRAGDVTRVVIPAAAARLTQQWGRA